MSGDDLHAPLGLNRDRAPGRKPLPWRGIGLGALAAGVAGLAALAVATDNGMGGEPFAVARIERAPKVAAAPARAPEPPATGAVVDATGTLRNSPGRSTASEIEAESGVRVVRQGGPGGAPGGLIIQVPDEFGVQLTPAPDKRLVEKGRFGSLPKIGLDGARPSEVYARPLITASSLKPGSPRLALVVGGMGLSQPATLSASSKLPGAVTLAFAPYGNDLDRQVARARESGHEVILQVPMEPFSMAESPGPHTLMTDAAPDQNIEHLHWLMSRFTGYVGIANFLGAKFMASPQALSPVLREAASRGLLWLDDGSSALAGEAPAGRGLRADIVIDAAQKPDAIEAQMLKLEALARQKGSAIGVATGLPSTVEQVARFARALERRGVALVPLSAFGAGMAAPTAGIGR